MGTSVGASPVSGAHPLIPDWVSNDHPVELPADTGSGPTGPVLSSPNQVVDASRRFANPRSMMSSAVRLTSTGALMGGGHGGSGGRHRAGRGTRNTPTTQVRKAVGQYVSARGGPSGITGRLGVAVDVGARLFMVLERIAREGFEAALSTLAVTLTEQSAGAIADALMNLVCGDAAANLEGILDESMARCACDETFIELYQQGISLTNITVDLVPDIIRSFATNAACLLITHEIGTMLVDRPRTEQESRTLQSTLRSVVEMSMRLELPVTPTSNHTVRDVREAISIAYRDAFQILQAAR
jgi:hypothetical protein